MLFSFKLLPAVLLTILAVANASSRLTPATLQMNGAKLTASCAGGEPRVVSVSAAPEIFTYRANQTAPEASLVLADLVDVAESCYGLDNEQPCANRPSSRGPSQTVRTTPEQSQRTQPRPRPCPHFAPPHVQPLAPPLTPDREASSVTEVGPSAACSPSPTAL